MNQQMLMMMMLIAPGMLNSITSIFNPNQQQSSSMSSLLPLMLLSGGRGMSMSNMLPLMLLSGSSGTDLMLPMVASQIMKPKRYYRRRRTNTANRLAYMAGAISVLKSRGG